MKHFFIKFFLCLLTISGFGQQTKDPAAELLSPIKKPRPSGNNLSSGYSAPKKIAVRSSWSLDANLSFLYWMPMEDNLEPGVILNTTQATSTKGKVIDFDFEYKPGLKVGIGFDMTYDNWKACSEYTRLHSHMQINPSIPFGEHISPIILSPQITSTNNYDSVVERWNLTLDFLDLFLSRSYFNGKHLTFSYGFGLRGAWIYQSLINQFGSIGNSVRGVSTLNGIVDSTLKSDSWALGPRVTLNGNWMICNGIRVYGNSGIDLLFSRYKLSRKEFSTMSNFTYTLKELGLNTLKTHLDLEVGLGWGTHFWNSKWHIDLSAGYGFQAFFDQNMFRTFYDANSFTGQTPNGNLYVQGLTVTAQLDF